jgi:ubiquinone/menaquinone biosynthesis C-methylase UbiE
MVESAHQTASAQGLRQVTFIRIDAEDLQFPVAVFDAILCTLGLMMAVVPVR